MTCARFEIEDETGLVVATTEGPRKAALRDAAHYAFVYAQDGPVKVYERVGRKRLEVGAAALDELDVIR